MALKYIFIQQLSNVNLKKKFKKRSKRQFPYESRAKIIGLNVPQTDVDIVKYPWKKSAKQTQKFRKEIALTIIMKMLTDDLEISDIIFKDNIQRKCRHNGEVSLREISTFETPPWYNQFGFVMDSCNKQIKETKLETLEGICMKTLPFWNETIEPFRKFFKLNNDSEDTIQDLMAHFVSNSIKKDKWNIKQKIEDINDDNPQRNCKSFQDIIDVIKKCGMKIKYLFTKMEKDTTLKYAPEKINEESESEENAMNEMFGEWLYDEYDRDKGYWQYLMSGWIVFIGLIAIICGCSIGFMLYHIDERYHMYK
eukprot:710579_1